MKHKPGWLPETRQFSQKDFNVVQRPEGLGGNGAEGVEPRDVRDQEVIRYAPVQVSPGRFDETYAYTAAGALGPVFNAQANVILYEKDLDFPAASVMIDNWTNQWLYIPDFRRYVPPYSGGWVYTAPKQTQIFRVQLKAPPAFAPAAAIAGEFVWLGFSEAFLPPQTGIITTVKTPVTA
jgi:hypothetical protein